MKQLSKYSDQIYAMLRILAGLMFAFHGPQILWGVLTDHPTPPMWSQAWVGGIIELVSGVLVALGLKTRWAAFFASGTMAVAYFQFHWKFQGGAEFFPAVNHGELAALYCFVFLFIASRGGVTWCVDSMKRSKK